MTALSSAFLFAGGHLAILLAHLLPNSTFILVENKAESLQRAIERTKKLHLTNCQFFQGESIRNFFYMERVLALLWLVPIYAFLKILEALYLEFWNSHN